MTYYNKALTNLVTYVFPPSNILGLMLNVAVTVFDFKETKTVFQGMYCVLYIIYMYFSNLLCYGFVVLY